MQSLTHQTSSDFEIVIADDGSNTFHRNAYEAALKTMPFTATICWQEDKGFRKTKILNEAIERANGDYLLFMDGDCIAHPEFVEEHMRLASKRHFLTGTRIRLGPAPPANLQKMMENNPEHLSPWDEGACNYGSYRALLKRHIKSVGLADVMSQIDPTKQTFNGCNASCWRADVIKVRGFDERMTYGGEDVEFGVRLQNCGIQPLSIRYHARCLHLYHDRPYFNAG